jgi:hypothetical protein
VWSELIVVAFKSVKGGFELLTVSFLGFEPNQKQIELFRATIAITKMTARKISLVISATIPYVVGQR